MESITSAGVPLDTTMHLLEQGEKYIPCSRTQDNSSEQGGNSTFASPQAMQSGPNCKKLVGRLRPQAPENQSLRSAVVSYFCVNRPSGYA